MYSYDSQKDFITAYFYRYSEIVCDLVIHIHTFLCIVQIQLEVHFITVNTHDDVYLLYYLRTLMQNSSG